MSNIGEMYSEQYRQQAQIEVHYLKEIEKLKILHNQEIKELKQKYKKSIRSLKEQLKNAIVPKFKAGQKVYTIEFPTFEPNGFISESDYVGKNQSKIIAEFCGYYGFKDKDYTFATREEAEKRLSELKGEMK